MSIGDNSIELENGSNLRSFINYTASALESLKSASEPIVLFGNLSGEIPGDTSAYADVALEPYNDRSNFATDLVKIEDNAIEVTPDFCSAVLLTSCEIKIGAPNASIYQRLSYQEIGSSEWKPYTNSVKRQVFAADGHQSVHEMWMLTPVYPVYKYKLEITCDTANTARDARQNCFALIALTSSQRG